MKKKHLRPYRNTFEIFDCFWSGFNPLIWINPLVLAYKAYLMDRYAPASVNAAIASLNSFFGYCEWYELRVKSLKIQRQVFASQDKELTKKEYERLLKVAEVRKKYRLSLLMQTICSTGIRVSELRFITVEAVNRGRAEIRCKGKNRIVFFDFRAVQAFKTVLEREQNKKLPRLSNQKRKDDGPIKYLG